MVLANTSAVDLAYVAGPWWNIGSVYSPGVNPGGQYTAGVLSPGANVDITPFYNGGAVAVVGSPLPFSSAASSSAADEGEISWPAGVSGSGGAATMYVAEVEVFATCGPAFKDW